MPVPAIVSTAPVADASPWTIVIPTFYPVAANTGWAISVNAASIFCGFMQADGTQNNNMGWDIYLPAGTWTLRQIHRKGTDAGIYTWSTDGNSIGTVDGYAASASQNNVSDITGIVVATSAKVRLLVKMATKNASSSSYWGYLAGAILQRTA